MSGTDLILVDTSVWIEAFRRGGDDDCREFVESELGDLSVCPDTGDAWPRRLCTCDLVIAELFCAAECSRSDLAILRDALGAVRVLPWPEGTGWRAVELAGKLATQGIRVSPGDLLMASLALGNHAAIAHRDRHFELMAGVVSLTTVNLGPSAK